MKLNANAIGVVTLTVTTIGVVGLICTMSAPAHDGSECEVHEVFRHSDTACYAPQGE